MENRNQVIYHEVLESMVDGVMVIDFNGVFELVNEAFCQTFELDRNNLIGRTFGEVFLTVEGYDDFAQIVLDATLDEGTSERQMVNVYVGDTAKSIAVTTSYISEFRGGLRERIAIVVVFTDVTKVREFREQELQFAKQIEKQHNALQKAYQDIESQKDTLSLMLKKRRTTRFISILAASLLFIGAGGYYLGNFGSINIQPVEDLIASFQEPDEPIPAPIEEPEINIHVVSTRPIDSTITLRGFLAPGNREGVIGPFNSNISKVFTDFGRQVKAGDPLVELSTDEIAIELRQAEVDYIKKLERLEELRNWEDSKEMANAQRRLQSAKLSLSNAKRKFDRTNFLFGEGIISTSEFEDGKQQYESQLLDFESAEDEFKSVKEQSNEETIRVAQLETENSKSRLDEIRDKMSKSTVIAPISGLVQRAGDNKGDALTTGQKLSAGDLLLSIANFDRIVVDTTVDEVDVNRIEPNQTAWISGPAFPEDRIEGQVTHVASNTQSRSFGGRSPQFQISVELVELNAAQRERLRAGMSAHVTIVIYSNPEAIMIPINSVQILGDGPQVEVVDASGNIEIRRVETGLTSQNSVEILSGLSVGEQIVIPEFQGFSGLLNQ
ncbi:MAG: efflux RND transporter periplasmic adaptor subunit [Gammaproteobacteria bacterium]|nr:efflux RND transporter periplasmic adaptor subunit [Gammaproteobacteria bacterium]MCY4218775.1 efflux RND transporter periplasmic adaptor subunit [Gammaproteobacteria bacterium]